MIYAQLDAAGQPVEIRNGSDTQIFRVRVADEAEAFYLMTPVGEYAVLPEPLTMTAQAFSHYGAEDFDRYGIAVFDNPVPPAGKVLDSYVFGLKADGSIKLTPTFVNIPAAQLPLEIPLYKVKNELADRGEQDAVEAWIGGMTGVEGQKARNLWAGAPNFVTASALGQAYKAYSGKTDAEYLEFCLAAAARVD